MSLRPWWVVALVLFVLEVAIAQDPTKAEPSHYKLAFENESVQVVNVHYGPHEKSSMHDHPGGVVVVISGGHLKFTDQHGNVQEVFAKAGESRWFPPFKHKVENLGDTPYDAVYIGVKHERSGPNNRSAIGEVQINAQAQKILQDIVASTKQ